MGSSIRGETNVKFTKNRVKHQASDDMKLFSTFAGLAAAQYVPQQMAPMGAPMGGMGGMGAMLPLLLLSDSGSSSSMSDLLPLMMLSGGMGGDMGGAGGMMSNPLMMMMLLNNDSSSSSSSTSDLLPLMLLGGGMGGDPNNPNAMSSMLPLLLLGDSGSALSDADATAICDGVDASLTVPCAAAVGDYTTASALCVSGTDGYDACVTC